MADSVDFQQAARYLDLDVSTVARYVKTGDLGVENPGPMRGRRISLDELEAFVERCRITPGTLYVQNAASRTRVPAR